MGIQGQERTLGYRLAKPTKRGARNAIVTTKDHKFIDRFERQNDLFKARLDPRSPI
jgi:hypothetical protein